MTTEILFTPSHVANFILKKAQKENLPITQLKLLKLVYLLYGWVLAVLDKRLFDEQFEAWKFGPVVSSLYHEFKSFGQNPITVFSSYMDVNKGLFQICKPFIEINEKNKDTLDVMTKAWEVYSPFTALSLVTQTHQDESPWKKHYNEDTKNKIIPDNEIKDFFVKEITEYVSNA